jgi:hypothetical protein
MHGERDAHLVGETQSQVGGSVHSFDGLLTMTEPQPHVMSNAFDSTLRLACPMTTERVTVPLRRTPDWATVGFSFTCPACGSTHDIEPLPRSDQRR